MSFLQLEGKTILVTGVANRKSVAYHVAKLLLEEGARVVLSVKDEAQRPAAEKLLPGLDVFVCDVERDDDPARLAEALAPGHPVLHGLLHSLAFANFSEGLKPFHETKRADFLQAVDISLYSLVALANALKPRFDADASVVTMSISTTDMAAESYGYMGPVKAGLDSAVVFLAKSFSAFSRVRFNAVKAGLLKTSASAGIPGYLDNYVYAERAALRKEALKTGEVAALAVFLLSPRSSGVNAARYVIDAGMGVNHFDRDLVRRATRPDPAP